MLGFIVRNQDFIKDTPSTMAGTIKPTLVDKCEVDIVLPSLVKSHLFVKRLWALSDFDCEKTLVL